MLLSRLRLTTSEEKGNRNEEAHVYNQYRLCVPPPPSIDFDLYIHRLLKKIHSPPLPYERNSTESYVRK